MTRDVYGYSARSPLDHTDPSGMCFLSFCDDWGSDVNSAWDATGGQAVSAANDAGNAVGGYVYEHSAGLAQITFVASALAYASCPVTAGAGCEVGAGLNYASAGLATLSAAGTCNDAGLVSRECALAAGDAALSWAGAIAPGYFALDGAHYARQTVWRSQALWNIAFDGVTNDISMWMHSHLNGLC